MAFRIHSTVTPADAAPAEDRPAAVSPQQWFQRAWRWLLSELDTALEHRISMERHELARRFKRG